MEEKFSILKKDLDSALKSTLLGIFENKFYWILLVNLVRMVIFWQRIHLVEKKLILAITFFLYLIFINKNKFASKTLQFSLYFNRFFIS